MIRDIAGLLRSMENELKARTEIAVVGMSGGADSTLVATLCSHFLGRENVLGVHLPATSADLATFNRNSQLVAEALGIRSVLISVGQVSEALNELVSQAMSGADLSLVNRGNGRARVRMSCLYALAHHLADLNPQQRVRVIGTGNLSEDYIGYDTKGGDALGDFFLIGELFKSEVYQLLEHFRDQGVLTEAMIDRHPSAGLWDGQTDEAELGYRYDEMEKAIRSLLAGDRPGPDASAVMHFVWQRHLAHRHKHEAPPVMAARGFCH
ncbi:MAG: NAD(+) synthase [Deltaproteobacteria bacterium]|nr:NAD(+) synthase [Deltaproteobacteria bacterium]